jgi:hypothetical protein
LYAYRHPVNYTFREKFRYKIIPENSFHCYDRYWYRICITYFFQVFDDWSVYLYASILFIRQYRCLTPNPLFVFRSGKVFRILLSNLTRASRIHFQYFQCKAHFIYIFVGQGMIDWIFDNKLLIVHGIMMTALLAASLYYCTQQNSCQVPLPSVLFLLTKIIFWYSTVHIFPPLFQFFKDQWHTLLFFMLGKITLKST